MPRPPPPFLWPPIDGWFGSFVVFFPYGRVPGSNVFKLKWAGVGDVQPWPFCHRTTHHWNAAPEPFSDTLWDKSFQGPCVPPYAIAPEYGIDRPFYLYVPSPLVDNYGFMREGIKYRGAMIIDLSQPTGPGPRWEQKWINYVNVVNSVKPWRTAGKPFVCDRLWLWTS